MARKESQAKRFERLAYEWQAGNMTRKRETYIFNVMKGKYLPYVKKRLTKDDKYDSQEVLAKYDVGVLEALNKWENRAAITTLIYNVTKYIFREYFTDEKPLVKKSEVLDTPPDVMDTQNLNVYYELDSSWDDMITNL